MKASLGTLLAQLPQPPSVPWPDGTPFKQAFAHGSMSVELFAPRGNDRQTIHEQDELYVVVKGSSGFVLDGEEMRAETGDILFVPAGTDHRFVGMSQDFATWVIFYGPAGGEAPAPSPSVFADVDA